MMKIKSISELIDQWDSIGAFSSAIGCGYEAARQMKRRNSIAPDHWQSVVDASLAKGLVGIDHKWLADQRSLPPTKDGEAA